MIGSRPHVRRSLAAGLLAAAVLTASACSVGDTGPASTPSATAPSVPNAPAPTTTSATTDPRDDSLQLTDDCARVLAVYDEATGLVPEGYVSVTAGVVLRDDQVAALEALAEGLGGLQLRSTEVARAIRDVASTAAVLVQRRGAAISAAEADRFGRAEHVLVQECGL